MTTTTPQEAPGAPTTSATGEKVSGHAARLHIPTCSHCARPTMDRVTSTGQTVVLDAHALAGGFDLYVIRADLTVSQVIGYSHRGFSEHTCQTGAGQ